MANEKDDPTGVPNNAAIVEDRDRRRRRSRASTPQRGRSSRSGSPSASRKNEAEERDASSRKSEDAAHGRFRDHIQKREAGRRRVQKRLQAEDQRTKDAGRRRPIRKADLRISKPIVTKSRPASGSGKGDHKKHRQQRKSSSGRRQVSRHCLRASVHMHGTTGHGHVGK